MCHVAVRPAVAPFGNRPLSRLRGRLRVADGMLTWCRGSLKVCGLTVWRARMALGRWRRGLAIRCSSGGNDGLAGRMRWPLSCGRP